VTSKDGTEVAPSDVIDLDVERVPVTIRVPGPRDPREPRVRSAGDPRAIHGRYWIGHALIERADSLLIVIDAQPGFSGATEDVAAAAAAAQSREVAAWLAGVAAASGSRSP
jgi:hypothetical protein